MCELLEVDRERCLQIYNYDEERVLRDIKLLKEWLKTQPHLPAVEDKFLEIMLLRSKYSLEKTKLRLDTYFTMKSQIPEYCENQDPLLPEIQNISKACYVVLMKNLSPDCGRVYVSKYLDMDALNIDNWTKYTFMMEEMRMEEDYSNGVHIVQDMADVNVKILTHMTPSWFKKLHGLYTVGFGSRILGIHILNAPPFNDILMAVFRPFMKPKLYDRIMIHPNLDSFHKVIPKKILPKDLGGDEPTLEEIQKQWTDYMVKSRPKFLEIMSKVVDESKRPEKLNDEIFGSMHGTFRKLGVD